jgi:hypothetical protein
MRRWKNITEKIVMDNLEVGEDVYFWEQGKDNYSFGTIKSDEHAYCLIDHILERNPVLPVIVHKSRISRDRIEIVRLIANTPVDDVVLISDSKPVQLSLFG